MCDIVKYRKANEMDISQIATTHIRCFPEYFISSLGTNLVEKYYLEYVRESDLFIVALKGDAIIGFCMGYIIGNTHARYNFLRHNRATLVKTILGQCLTLNKRTLKQCYFAVINKIFPKKTGGTVKQGGDLLSICVLKEERGKGISKELLIRFEEKLKEKKIDGYWLGVYKTNEAAIRFYLKNGMKKEQEEKEEYKFHKVF